MLQEQVDMVAGDFDGPVWRRQSGNEQRYNSTVEEAFANMNLPNPPGPTPLWGPGGVPGEWADVRGFIKPPESETEWRVGTRCVRNPSRKTRHQNYGPELPPRSMESSPTRQRTTG